MLFYSFINFIDNFIHEYDVFSLFFSPTLSYLPPTLSVPFLSTNVSHIYDLSFGFVTHWVYVTMDLELSIGARWAHQWVHN